MKTSLLFSLTLFANVVSGQQGLSNSGNLHIHSSGTVRMTGSFTNASAASLINNGTMRVLGNVINDQVMSSYGTGMLILEGTTMQTMSGNSAFHTLHLNTNNSSGIVLANDISVWGTHTFSSGMIQPNAGKFLIYEEGAGYAGASDLAHINGWARKRGSTDFLFPVGTGTALRPMMIQNLSGNSDFAVRHHLTTPATNQTIAPLVSIDRFEYWSVDQISGGTAHVTMNWDDSKVNFPTYTLPELQVARWNGTAWTPAGGSASGDVNTTGTITSSVLNTFSRFTFGSSNFPLPLTLLSFSATRKELGTDIQWNTTAEINVDRFEVERSNDGRSFYKLASSPARNSGLNERYHLIDGGAIQNQAYYRLKMIDLDGSFKYSSIVRIRANDNWNLKLFKNPTTSVARLESNRSGSVGYIIHTVSGKRMQEGRITMTAGTVNTIDISRLIAGSYTITIYDDEEIKIIRMIVL